MKFYFYIFTLKSLKNFHRMASNYTLDLKERYTACMVLHAVGDAMG